MKITIDKENTKNIGKRIIENSENLTNDIKQVENIVDAINSAWEGADALKYVNTMKDKYIASMQEFSETVKKYGEYISNVPGAYSILDETFSNKNINV